jgi:hypothetical protein
MTPRALWEIVQICIVYKCLHVVSACQVPRGHHNRVNTADAERFRGNLKYVAIFMLCRASRENL